MCVIQYFIFVCQKLEVLRVHLLPSNWLVVIASRTMTAKRNPKKFPLSVNNSQLMYQVVLYADYLLYNYFVYNNQGINTCCHLVKNGKNKGQFSSFIHILMDTETRRKRIVPLKPYNIHLASREFNYQFPIKKR